MPTYSHHTKIEIRAAPAAIFDYVTNVSNWPSIHPASRHTESKGVPLMLGDSFEEIVANGLQQRRMHWVVTTCDRPKSWAVEGTSVTGPRISARIAYALSDAGGTTTF